MSRTLQIIRATPDFAPALTEIAFAAKRHWSYPESWIQSWSRLLTITPQYLMAHETHMATKDARIVGFYSLKPEAGEIHLEHLWVLPEAMGQGIGRALFAHAVGRTRALDQASLRIESDPNAAGFYLRMGAHRVGARTTETEEEVRELPLFVYDIGP